MEQLAMIDEVFPLRTFEVTDVKGDKRTMKAKDLIFKTAQHRFMATAYDDLADHLEGHQDLQGKLASVDITLTCNKIEGKDGKPDWYRNSISIRNICVYG